MVTELMDPPARMSTRPEPSPREIIDSGRRAAATSLGALGISCVTAGLMWGSFTPLDFGPMGWVCLIPLLVLVRLQRPTQRMYGMIYLGGLAFWLPTLQWMRLGDPSMYVAWLALTVYLAIYFPVFVGISRLAVHRFSVPMVIAAPVAWVALEFARGHLLTGFGWYYLGHTQYRWTDLIQISDLVGAFGVSFVMVATSAAFVDFIPQTWLAKWGLLPASRDSQSGGLPKAWGLHTPTFRAVFCIALVGASLIYGNVRRSSVTFPAGPRVAAVQGNFPTSLRDDQEDWGRIYQQHVALTAEAVKQQADLIVWPETMFRWPLYQAPLDMSAEELEAAVPGVPASRWRDTMASEALTNLSQQAGAALVIGLQTNTATPQGMAVYNSALFVSPEKGIAGRYDKQHRVPFGEYIPFGDVMQFAGSPYRGPLGLSAGTEGKAFEYQQYRFSPVICFEDTVPHVVRKALLDGEKEGKSPDVILNLTNDGWFHGSSELDQHLITAAFRSVEFRTPMVRAVNTGISAIIDGDGVIRYRAVDPVTKQSKQVSALLVEHVPLDPRSSYYLRFGDWFGKGCLSACGIVLLAGMIVAFRRPTMPATSSA